eukprot:TRINITY_DN19113_c0_g1_i1.p1 TRINITY_DN19113_c0_g1~~TRINITY_DN19113_c0_g1_i1.p1  ORF type:complete len:184 (+),score=35.78 TRINITY_DN19113_c0_g1_i1:69-620(+)
MTTLLARRRWQVFCIINLARAAIIRNHEHSEAPIRSLSFAVEHHGTAALVHKSTRIVGSGTDVLKSEETMKVARGGCFQQPEQACGACMRGCACELSMCYFTVCADGYYTEKGTCSGYCWTASGPGGHSESGLTRCTNLFDSTSTTSRPCPTCTTTAATTSSSTTSTADTTTTTETTAMAATK